MTQSLSDRMKTYEHKLVVKFRTSSAVFIRVDGRGFSRFTSTHLKPFDPFINAAMAFATVQTAKELGAVLSYTQSDEATFMLLTSNPADPGLFGYKRSKLESIAASVFTAHFNQFYSKHYTKIAYFDARSFGIPIDDAPNAFVYRQQDGIRNSVSAAASSKFSHQFLHGASVPERLKMLAAAGTPWERESCRDKYGLFVTKSGRVVSDQLDYENIMQYIGISAYKNPLVNP